MKTILLSLVITVCVGNCFAYYSSEQGRWLNRDPIGEDGGVNEYQFCGNNGVNYWDYLGNAFEKIGIDRVIHKPGGVEYVDKLFVDFSKSGYGDTVAGGTKIIDFEVKCTIAECEKDIYPIKECVVSWKAKVGLNKNYNGHYGGNARTVLGHEHMHYFSWMDRIAATILPFLAGKDDTNSSTVKASQLVADGYAKDAVTKYKKMKEKVKRAGGDQAGHNEDRHPIPFEPLLILPNHGEFPRINEFPNSWELER